VRCRKHQWYLMGHDVRFDTQSLGLIPLKAAIDRFCCKSLFGVMSDNFQER